MTDRAGPTACTKPPGPLGRAVSWVLIRFVRAYQLLISPLLGPTCRFQPTCSAYTVTCLSTHGPLRGSWLAVKRIARCHPFHPGGFDPPPPPPGTTAEVQHSSPREGSTDEP